MGARSKIALGAVLKNFRRLAQHPWIGAKLATLQGEKWLFNLLYPRARYRPGPEDPPVELPHHRPVQSALPYLRPVGRPGVPARPESAGTEAERSLPGALPGSPGRPGGPRPPALRLPLGRRAHALRGLGGVDRTRHRLGAALLASPPTAPGLPRRPSAWSRRPCFSCRFPSTARTPPCTTSTRPGVGGADNFADIQAGLAAVHEARRAQGQQPAPDRLAHHHFPEQFPASDGHLRRLPGQSGPVCLLPLLVDRRGSGARPTKRIFPGASGLRRCGPAGWVGGWRPDDYAEMDRQLQARPGQVPGSHSTRRSP